MSDLASAKTPFPNFHQSLKDCNVMSPNLLTFNSTPVASGFNLVSFSKHL